MAHNWNLKGCCLSSRYLQWILSLLLYIAKTTWLSENAQFWTTNNFVWGHRNSRKFTCGVLIQSVFLCRPCETTYFIPSRDVITKFILFPNFERFPKNICDGYGLPTGDACSSRIPVPFHFGLVLLVENNSFPELVVIFRTLHCEHPSVLSRFCFNA